MAVVVSTRRLATSLAAMIQDSDAVREIVSVPSRTRLGSVDRAPRTHGHLGFNGPPAGPSHPNRVVQASGESSPEGPASPLRGAADVTVVADRAARPHTADESTNGMVAPGDVVV